jgi:hypothetical protein
MEPMSAELVTSLSAAGQADETVRRSVRALIQGRGVDKDEVARSIGMARTTLYRRLSNYGSTQAFSAGEAALIARYFDIPVSSLFDGLGGAFIFQEGKVMSACSRLSPAHDRILHLVPPPSVTIIAGQKAS